MSWGTNWNNCCLLNTILQFIGRFPVCPSINRDRKAHCSEKFFMHTKTKAHPNTAEMTKPPGSVMGLDCKYVCVWLSSICQPDENGTKTGRSFQTILMCRSSFLKSLLTMKYTSAFSRWIFVIQNQKGGKKLKGKRVKESDLCFWHLFASCSLQMEPCAVFANPSLS